MSKKEKPRFIPSGDSDDALGISLHNEEYGYADDFVKNMIKEHKSKKDKSATNFIKNKRKSISKHL